MYGGTEVQWKLLVGIFIVGVISILWKMFDLAAWLFNHSISIHIK